MPINKLQQIEESILASEPIAKKQLIAELNVNPTGRRAYASSPKNIV